VPVYKFGNLWDAVRFAVLAAAIRLLSFVSHCVLLLASARVFAIDVNTTKAVLQANFRTLGL